MRIAICDSDKVFQRQICDYISRDADIEDDYVVECFDSIIQVKERLDGRNFNFDLLFLMIEKSGKDSIAVIKYIHEKKFDVDVFLIASNTDYITEAFRAKVFNYIVKPLEYKKFEYEMSQYLHEKKEYKKEYLSVKIKGGEQMIPLNSVLYFISEVRKIGAFFLNDEKNIWFYGKLDNLEKRLEPYGYIRCHQSYLINGRKIEGIDSTHVITSGGLFPISRRYQNNVKEKWENLKKIMYHNARIEKMDSIVCNNLTSEDSATINRCSTVVITKKYSFRTLKYGVLVGITGDIKNNSYRLYDNDEVVIGRDSKQSHIVINNCLISRKHCSIKFDMSKQCYKICDYSTNGTFINGKVKLKKAQWIKVDRDTVIQLANENCSFLLI